MSYLTCRVSSTFYFFLVLCLASVSVHAKPKVSWSEQSLNVEVINGTVVVKNVSFVTTEAIEDLSFMIGDDCDDEGACSARPGLDSLIEVVQLTPGPAAAGVDIQLALIFTIPTNTPYGEYPGTLHVREGRKTVERPLMLNLSILHGSSDVVPVGIASPTPERIIQDLSTGSSYIADEALIGLADNRQLSQLQQSVADHNGVFFGSIPEINLYQVRFPSVNTDAELDGILVDINVNPIVKYAFRVWSMEPYYTTPNDSYYGLFGSNLGSPWVSGVPAGTTDPLEYVRLPEAWDLTTGNSKIKIAIVDDAFDENHVDLKGNVGSLSGSNLPFFQHHGTSVAGVAAAVGNNGVGVSGVMWDATLDLYAVGDAVTTIIRFQHPGKVVRAMLDAVRDGASIVNVSLGQENRGASITSYVEQMYRDAIELPASQKVLFVLAAGNDDHDVSRHIPASLASSYDNVISVAGLGFDGNPWAPINRLEYNNGGLIGKFTGGDVTVAAPSLYLTTVNDREPPYDGRVGSSFSAPMVAGLAGLVLSRNTNVTPSQLKDIIKAGSCSGPNARKVDGEHFYVVNAFESVLLADNPRAARDACISTSDDQATVQSGVATEIDVLDNDSVPDGYVLSIVSTTPGAHGSVDITNNGVRDTVAYTSEPGYVGTDTFIYTVTDGNAGSATATVTVTVTPTPSTAFTIGNAVEVTADAIPSVNVRPSASTSGDPVGTQLPGAAGTVTGGPEWADGYWWWQVDFDNSDIDGWVVEGYLQKNTSIEIQANLRCGADWNAWHNNYSSHSFTPNSTAFAALNADGHIAAWGYPERGGSGAPTDSGYVRITPSNSAFAALKNDGSIFAWGTFSWSERTNPGTITIHEPAGLHAPTDKGYISIASTVDAFAALKEDGSIFAWGGPFNGGRGAPTDAGYVSIFSAGSAFAAVKADGSITAWGDGVDGGNYGGFGAPTDSGYVHIATKSGAFAAMKADGSITAWGSYYQGGNGAPTDSGYTSIVSTSGAFAALKRDGSIVAWGDALYGGTGAPTDSGYVSIASSYGAFAALKPDGSITVWGVTESISGGSYAPSDSGYVRLTPSGQFGFAALKDDGSITVWGYGNGTSPSGTDFVRTISAGADPGVALRVDGSVVSFKNVESIYDQPIPTDSGYVSIATTQNAFAALKADGSITTWGYRDYGGSGGPTDAGYVSINGVGTNTPIDCRFYRQ